MPTRMKRLPAIAGCLLALGLPRFAQAGTMFTNPVIFVTPANLNFGLVATNATATNTFLVENMGSGRLVGTATVPAPFKILSGGKYTLGANEAQILTITYTPSGTASDTQTVKFTGGGETKATVTGKPGATPPKKPKRK
jgi:hypothetical protein